MANKTLLCLGPKGTHSEAAVKESKLIGAQDFKELNFSASISDIFQQLADGNAAAGFIPIENNLEGPVSETLDSLISYKDSISVNQSFNYRVKHALGTLSAESKITATYSHPQALGQCSDFLTKNYPKAAKCALESSAAAIEHIKSNQINDAGVIALKETLESHNFHILNEDISNSQENITRFILVSKEILKPKKDSLTEGARYITSILIEPAEDRPGLLYNILKAISYESNVNIRTIHSRPDQKGGFKFFLDLEGHPESSKIKACIDLLRKEAPTDAGKGSKIYLTGSYEDSSPIKIKQPKVGIIGASGKMGSWFSSFFSKNGFPVLESDLNSELSAKELAEKADILILSVPMAEILKVVKEINEPLQKRIAKGDNPLIIENCSIKESSLEKILLELPKGLEVLALHTMFGDSVDNISGENIVFTKTSRGGPLSSKIEDLFAKKGANLSFQSKEEHDLGSALSQSLVHLILLAYGQTSQNIKDSVNDELKISTPNSRALDAALSRVCNQSEELLFELQKGNSKAFDVRAKFLQNILKLTLSLSRDKQIFTHEEGANSKSKVPNGTFLNALEEARNYSRK